MAMGRWVGCALLVGALAVGGCDCGGPIAGADAGPDARDSGVLVDAGGSDAAAGDALGGDAALPSLFVDPISGNDNGTCPQAHPCKTIARALAVASNGQTVYLNAGTYGEASGETWDVPVPDGVTIEAVTQGQAIVLGPGRNSMAVAFTFTGGGELRYLQIKQFKCGIFADDGVVLADNVEFVENETAVCAERVGEVALEDCVIRDGGSGFRISGIAALTFNGGRISGATPNCSGGVEIGTAGDSAQVTLDGIEASNNYGTLELRSSARATIRNSTFDTNGTDGCGGSDTITMGESSSLTLDNTSIRNSRGSGIRGVYNIHITGGSIVDSARAGITFDGTWLDVSGTHLSGGAPQYAGIEVADGSSVRFENITVSGFGSGVNSDLARITLRGSTISGNTYGVVVHNTADLGTAADPGNNVIHQNTTSNLVVSSEAPFSVNASGNTWDPNIQGTDAQGHMSVGATLTGATSGDNFLLYSDGPTIRF